MSISSYVRQQELLRYNRSKCDKNVIIPVTSGYEGLNGKIDTIYQRSRQIDGNTSTYSSQSRFALSTAQYSKAQEVMPNILGYEVTNRVGEAVRDRFIQEKLKIEYDFVDSSKEGLAAYQENCRVIHHPIDGSVNHFESPGKNY